MSEQIQLTPEEIASNFEKFEGYISKISDDRKDPALKMVSHLGERLALCPASGRLDYHNCFPGGLVEHSMRVLGFALKLRKLLDVNPEDVSTNSLILVCLFHDLGKVGDLDNDYYIPQDSNWHREKLGEHFKVNQDMTYMTVPHRSVWLCQQFGVRLTKEEMLGILLHDGQYVDDNKPYKMKEPAIAIIAHQADLLAGLREKGSL